MITRWTCNICKKIEKTGPNVKELAHVHGGLIYPLESTRKARKAPGLVTVKSLKAEVWDLFSEYIRRRDSDENGYIKCCTCGKSAHWKEVDAGHFISRKQNMTLYDERNSHAQCKYCNGPKQGNIIAYQDFMLNKYGQKTVDELWRLARITHEFTVRELTALKEKYKNLIPTKA
jgi:hypothetical protein